MSSIGRRGTSSIHRSSSALLALAEELRAAWPRRSPAPRSRSRRWRRRSSTCPDSATWRADLGHVVAQARDAEGVDGRAPARACRGRSRSSSCRPLSTGAAEVGVRLDAGHHDHAVRAVGVAVHVDRHAAWRLPSSTTSIDERIGAPHASSVTPRLAQDLHLPLGRGAAVAAHRRDDERGRAGVADEPHERGARSRSMSATPRLPAVIATSIPGGPTSRCPPCPTRSASAASRSSTRGRGNVWRMRTMAGRGIVLSYSGRARAAARSSAARMLAWSAWPVPAMSKAVPWSTLVRKKGSPTVTLTPGVEAHELDRDVALVVVLDDDDVEAALARVHEDRVGRPRARWRRCPPRGRRRRPGRSRSRVLASRTGRPRPRAG